MTNFASDTAFDDGTDSSDLPEDTGHGAYPRGIVAARCAYRLWRCLEAADGVVKAKQAAAAASVSLTTAARLLGVMVEVGIASATETRRGSPLVKDSERKRAPRKPRAIVPSKSGKPASVRAWTLVEGVEDAVMLRVFGPEPADEPLEPPPVRIGYPSIFHLAASLGVVLPRGQVSAISHA